MEITSFFVIATTQLFIFIQPLKKDGGAGVGRISSGLLKKYFDRIHVVEVAESLIQQARVSLTTENAEFFCVSLHEFQPTEQYDVIWLQASCKS